MPKYHKLLSAVVLILASVSFLLSAASCKRAKPLEGKELVRINDRVITVQEFEQEMEQLPPYYKTLMVSAEGRKRFLQEFINAELLLQEGKKKGLDKDKDVLAKIEQFRKGLIIDTLVGKLYEGKDEVSDEEVKAYYRQNKKQFFLGERVRVRHILVKTLPEAREIKRRLDNGEDFITLVREYSISPSKAQDGDLGYIEKGKTGKEFEKAAFALTRPGEISNIVKTTFGYHIIRLEDRAKPRQLTFAEAQDNIRNFLREKKRKDILAAHMQELHQQARIRINEQVLAAEEGDGS
jgi:hypothetical protein